MSRQLNRRAILAGAAAIVPAAALAGTPALNASQIDPIFAAIEEHRRLHDDLMRKFDRANNDDDSYSILFADEEAHWRLLDIAPTTPAGIAALVRYAQQQDTDGEFWPDWPEEGDWYIKLFNVVAAAAETMAMDCYSGFNGKAEGDAS